MSDKRRATMSDFEWRKASSERRTGRPAIISPYIPEAILRWDSYHNRWQTKNPRTGATAFHAQVVWEYYNGVIPDGYVVHHKSGRASEITDDRPDNLMLLPRDVNSKLFPTLAKELGVPESIITDTWVAANGDIRQFLFLLSSV